MKFTKEAAQPEAHLQLLKKRGLTIKTEQRFFKYLKNVGYYRLTGYMYPFQAIDGSHEFKAGTTFEEIIDHYIFDKELRSILLNDIERIEISIRASLNNTMSLKYGTHWYLNNTYFNNADYHSKFINDVKKYCKDANEIFIKNYLSKYTDPTEPPSWMIMETLTFGDLAKMFENLIDNEEKKQIAAEFKTVVPIFESWLKSINFIRNCCAHHSRLWNRKIPLKPTIPTRKKNRFLNNVDIDTDKRLYGVLSCILFLTLTISPKSQLKNRIKNLISKYPSVNIEYMGFSGAWEEEDLWK